MCRVRICNRNGQPDVRVFFGLLSTRLTCSSLKWKPPSENSIDFKLELRFPPLPDRPSEPDFTAKPVFQLLVWTGGHSYEHFDIMQVDDAQWERWVS